MAKKTVLKRMRVMGLFCQARRRKRYISFRGKTGKVFFFEVAEEVLDHGVVVAVAPHRLGRSRIGEQSPP